jgi:hypothetical protein
MAVNVTVLIHVTLLIRAWNTTYMSGQCSLVRRSLRLLQPLYIPVSKWQLVIVRYQIRPQDRPCLAAQKRG